MTPARFRWGTIFITVGALLLLRNVEVLNDDVWFDLLLYAPVVLIAIGIEKIFTKTRLQAISYATSVALVAAALAIAFHASSGGPEGSFFSEASHQVDYDPSVQLISAELDLGRTDLTIRDAGRDIVYAEFDRFTRKPRISYRVEEETARLEYNCKGGSYLGGAVKIETGDPQDWYVQFSDRIPLELQCSGYESDIHLNMATTPLRRLKLDADEATIYLKIGHQQPQVDVIIKGEDSRLKLRLPECIGLRIAGEDYKSYLSRLGLIDAGGGRYQTEGFDTLQTKVDLILDDHLSSFSIDFF